MEERLVMKTQLNYGRIAALLGGGVVGAAIGWVIGEVLAYQLFEKPLEDRYEEEFGEVVEEYSPEEEAPVMMTKSDLVRPTSIVNNYAEKFKSGKLNIKLATDDEIDHEEEPEETGPFIMAEEEWLDPKSTWETVNLTYYEDDRVLVDERTEEIVKNPETLIGSLALTSFGELCSDPDTVFIQNNDEELYYEVSRLHGSYGELVLGLPKAKKKPGRILKDIPLDESEEKKADSRKIKAKMKAKINNGPDETTEE